MPPSGILGKNRASRTFSGIILSTWVIATFRQNLATRVLGGGRGLSRPAMRLAGGTPRRAALYKLITPEGAPKDSSARDFFQISNLGAFALSAQIRATLA
jgi:hypothetical protein